tara:strand:+ start:911 stop:1348 length:438 start_codon:yes stop_codon:yes gene_type:complete
MEYTILGIDKNSSINEAKSALRKIRLENHPDKLINVSSSEKQKALQLLQLSEEAYRRIKEKQEVNQAVNSVMIPTVINNFDNIFSQMKKFTESNPGNNVSTTSYTYSNINGNVKESGTINGRQMSSHDLQHMRPTFQSPFSHIRN